MSARRWGAGADLARFRRAVAGILTLGVLLVLAGAVLPNYLQTLESQALIFGVLAMSLDVVFGYAGLPSLGQAGYFGVGAYVFGLVALHVSRNFWLGALVACAGSLLVAALFGLLALRARGAYFMMITLALSQVLLSLTTSWRGLTGGADGLNVPRLAGIPDHHVVLVVAAGFAVVLLALYVLAESPFGYALRGIRDSETRMEALGYNVWRYKYAAFVLSGACGGLAGVLSAYQTRYVDPTSLGVLVSGEAFVMVIFGGVGTLIGPAAGAACIVVLSNFVSSRTSHWEAVLGVIYIGVVLFAPQGLVRLRVFPGRRHRVALPGGAVGPPRGD